MILKQLICTIATLFVFYLEKLEDNLTLIHEDLNMQEPLDLLQHQAQVLKEIDQLLAAKDFKEYRKNHPKLMSYLAENGYKKGAYETLDALFDNFDFKIEPEDPRTTQLQTMCADVRVNITSSALFFHLLHTTFNKIADKKNPAVMARGHMRKLIGLQQTDIQRRISALLSDQLKSQPTSDAPQAQVVANSNLRQTCAKYGIPAAVFTVGISLTTVSALMQLSPQFALLVGVKVAPLMLVSVAALGAVLAAFAVYRAIRTYYPAQANSVADVTLASTQYSKLLTAATMMSGLGASGFAALMQFSPKFAMLVGLHLSPAALITVATMGTALMAYGIYRAYQSYKQAHPTLPATAAAPESTPCKTLISKYLSCCFNYGGAKKPNVTIILDSKVVTNATSSACN